MRPSLGLGPPPAASPCSYAWASLSCLSWLVLGRQPWTLHHPRLRQGWRTQAAAWEQAALQGEVQRLMASLDSGKEGSSTGPHSSPYQQQRLFSVYVHMQPGGRLPADSVFAGREIGNPVDTSRSYAQPALMQASRQLLAAALADPLNIKFVLLSDSSIPLMPPGLLWAQLLSERRSRVDACRDVDMQPESQWWSVDREHAALAVLDTHVAELFAQHCFSGVRMVPADSLLAPHAGRSWLAKVRHFARKAASAAAEWVGLDPWLPELVPVYDACIADEHYLPTLLASYGLEEQTDCLGLATFADWPRATGSHPYTFLPADLTRRLAADLRSQHTTAGRREGLPACAWEEAAASLRHILGPPGKHVRSRSLQSSTIGSGVATRPAVKHRNLSHVLNVSLPVQVSSWLLSIGYQPVSARCALFARKFPSEGPPPFLPGQPRADGVSSRLEGARRDDLQPTDATDRAGPGRLLDVEHQVEAATLRELFAFLSYGQEA
ncbi:hypothetical protein QJQ45_018249 [Haematococcus lacustris]|nr:hypothetical protein QJQ45_018249 [Haematococcus lacustris]